MVNFSSRTLPIGTYAIGLICLLMTSCTIAEIDKGDKLAEQGNWDGAVALYSEGFKQDPFNDEIREKLDNAKEHAAQGHYKKGQQWLKASRIPEALQEFQLASGLDPYKPEYTAGLVDALRLKEANQALSDGKKLHSLGRLDEALSNYERALQLNPDLAEALNQITTIAQYQQAYQAMGQTTEPVTMRFQNTRLKQVFEILARTADIDILFDKDVRDDLVTIFTRDTPFPEALNLILTTNQLFAKRVAPDTLLIIPDTKQKHEQYQDLKVRTFYLSNAKAKDMANLLRTILETKRVYVNEPLNTIVIRDAPAKVMLAEQILMANDRSDSEVLLEVEVIEVVRQKNESYGLDFVKSFGIGAFAPGEGGNFGLNPLSASTQIFTFADLAQLGTSSYLISFPSNVVVNFFKSVSNTKTLASPKLRVRNREKASINVGDKQPILLSTTNVLPGQAASGATPTTSTVTSIEFKDVGIKVTVEPTINLNNAVSLRLQVEIVTIGPLITLQGGDNPIQVNSFGQRSADTALLVKDGETVVLGGLMREDDTQQRESIWWVDDHLPWLGEFLSATETQKIRTEIILIITPRVVRNVAPIELAKQSIWSGTAKKFSTNPLFTEQETPMTLVNGNGELFEKNGGLPHLEEPQTVPVPELVPELVPEPAPESAPAAPSDSSLAPPRLPDPKDEAAQASLKPTAALLTLRPASVSTTVGEEIRVDLTAQDIPSIEKSQVTISFDPEIVQFTQALEGSFWKQNNIPPSLNVSAVPQKGQVVIQMGRTGQSAKGSGQLATLIFKAKSTGDARLEIQRPTFLQPDNKPVPVMTHHGRISVQ
jgi:general secretion pathway protein D